MRLFLLVALLTLVSCVGSPEPRNPLKRTTERAWWQASTAGVTSNNPWNKFVPKEKGEDISDPWANFQEPELFPEGFAVRNVKKNKQPLDRASERRIIPSREVY